MRLRSLIEVCRVWAAMATLLVTLPVSARSDALPKGFVYLTDIDPSIAQDIRYFSQDNFLGRKVTGYQAGECILTERAARALAKVQASLQSSGFGLKVFDCYRPARAVADFAAWANTTGTKDGPSSYYPTIPKNRLLPLGYIAPRSNHSAGSTVDAALIRQRGSSESARASEGTALETTRQQPSAGTSPTSRDSGSCLQPARDADGVDMGTDFDCFHPYSSFASSGVSQAARKNRAVLRRAMSDAGFDPYEKEWWHFRLRDEPFRNQVFDFPIVAREKSATEAR